MSILDRGLSMPPMLGIGHGFALREYALNGLHFDTTHNDGYFTRGVKTVANTAIRCSAFAYPHIENYLAIPYTIYASRYVNAGMAVAKGVYSPLLYLKGRRDNNQQLVAKAKRMGLEALGHTGCFFVDGQMLSLSKNVWMGLSAGYIAAGAALDIGGWSRRVHNKMHRFIFGRDREVSTLTARLRRITQELLRKQDSLIRARERVGGLTRANQGLVQDVARLEAERDNLQAELDEVTERLRTPSPPAPSEGGDEGQDYGFDGFDGGSGYGSGEESDGSSVRRRLSFSSESGSEAESIVLPQRRARNRISDAEMRDVNAHTPMVYLSPARPGAVTRSQVALR